MNIEAVTENSIFWNEINLLAEEAFPPEEYIAPSKLLEMSESGTLNFFELSDDGRFVGFAAVLNYKKLSYLFFLAIAPECRSKGYGSLAIEGLRKLYSEKKHVVDFEMTDETADNNAQRIKRRSFYLHNGYRETGLFLSYFGVDYEVFCSDGAFDPDEFKEMMSTIGIDGFNPVYFSEKQ